MGALGGPECTPGYYNNEGQDRRAHCGSIRSLRRRLNRVLQATRSVAQRRATRRDRIQLMMGLGALQRGLRFRAFELASRSSWTFSWVWREETVDGTIST